MVHAQPNPQLKDLPQRRWSVNDYHCMIASGILTQSDHVELLEGCIIEMVPQEPPHASITSSFGNDFVMLFAGKAWVRQQLPITIAPNSEPEPDVALVRIDPNRYRDRHPVPEDIYLLIEVSHSTLNYDRHHKAKIYAKANIPEYWVVDVNQQQILVFREPQEGSYQVEQVLGVNDAIIPLAFPDVRVELSNLFV
ncbi:MAG: Uma2 family endonuclease [Chroococcidiopsidaceae cyanobacterium CP_BM_RX_35]|nr:Uma2 family endonuclease [Chroococcidiopsidaceae cyanobacterium CP_BM_RX_35]